MDKLLRILCLNDFNEWQFFFGDYKLTQFFLPFSR